MTTPPTKSVRVVPRDISKARAMWGEHFLFFCDLSKWQKKITSYQKLSQSIDAAIIKISGILSDGTLYEDGLAKRHIAGLKSIPCGGYHYCKFVGDDSRKLFPVEQQAEYFIKAAKKYPLTILAPDMEPGELKAAIRAGLSPEEIEDWTRTFVDILEDEAPANPPAMYASRACIKAADGGLDWMRDNPLLQWWAGYPTPPFSWPFEGPAHPLAWPGDWPLSNDKGPRWAWQYWGGDHDSTPAEDGGEAPGVDGDIDCNITPRNGAFAQALTQGRVSPHKNKINWAGLGIFSVLGLGAWAGLKKWTKKR